MTLESSVMPVVVLIWRVGIRFECRRAFPLAVARASGHGPPEFPVIEPASTLARREHGPQIRPHDRQGVSHGNRLFHDPDVAARRRIVEENRVDGDQHGGEIAIATSTSISVKPRRSIDRHPGPRATLPAARRRF